MITNAKRPKMSDRPGKISGLTITRKEHENILIRVNDTDVWISVDSIKGRKVRLTFQAPAAVAISREELIEYGDVPEVPSQLGTDRG